MSEGVILFVAPWSVIEEHFGISLSLSGSLGFWGVPGTPDLWEDEFGFVLFEETDGVAVLFYFYLLIRQRFQILH